MYYYVIGGKNMKEKIVHTRVSKNLYKKISEKARKNRISISNLIRNIIEDSIEIYEDVSDIVDEKIIEFLDKRDSILAFQEVKLNKNTKCGFCGKTMNKNNKAYLGLFEKSLKKVIICGKCYEKNNK